MKQLCLLLLIVFNFTNGFSFKILPPSATIGGTTTVCLNAASPLITFTGNGGNAPYTFTYTVTGMVGNQTITTTSGNSVTVSAPTGASGTFTYTLVSVAENNGTPVPVTGTATVIVSAPPTVDYIFTNDNTCSGTSIQFIPTVTGSGLYTYSWDFGDLTALSTQQNPSHQFTSLGCGTATFNVVLTVTGNGCTVTRAHTVTVKQKPNISFNDPNALNGNPLSQFSNCTVASISNTSYSITVENTSPSSSCISSYSINWGDTNSQSNITFPISHPYTQLGVYNMVITAIGNFGCVNSITYQVKNISNPSAGVLNPGGTVDMCIPTPLIQYTIGNWALNSPGTTYAINYGDNSPILNISQATMVASPYYNSINPLSSVNYPIPYSYTTNSCPGGDFTITLVVTNACRSTTGTVVGGNTRSKPIANFDAPTNGCLNSSILFDNTTILGYDSGCISDTRFIWNFGDPASGANNIITTGWVTNAPDANHIFSSPGLYTVTLTAQNGCGITTVTKQICIEPPLIPQFTLNNNSGCTPLPVTTTNTTNLANACPGNPTYLWNVTYASGFCGSGTAVWSYTSGTATSASPSFSFVTPGTYTISLTTTNSCGAIPSPVQTVTVKKPPTVTLSNINPNPCQNVSFTPSATIDGCPNADITNYLWTFSGGTPATAATAIPPAVSYATTGNHTITLAVTNGCGTTTATSNTFNVLSSPTVQNETLTICSGIPFSITPSTATSGNIIPAGTTYTWNAPIVTGGMTGGVGGTNQTSINGTLLNPTSLVQTATYSVTPRVGSCFGNTFTVIVTVNPAAQVNQPIAVSVCNGATTSAINFTTTNPSGTTFSWTNSTPSIGLAASGNGSVPAFTAVNTTNAPIIATITVTPSFSGGSAICSGVSKTFTITVNPTGQVNQPTSLIKCNGDSVAITFSSSNTGGSTFYNWTNDTPVIGLPATGTGNISFTATNSTSTPLVATIIVTPSYNNGSSNCVGTSKTFTITINPSAQVNQPTAIFVCNGNTIPTTTFSTSNTSGTTSYSWTNSNTTIGLSASGTGDIPAFTAINTGNSVLTATIVVTPSYLVGATTCTGNTKQFTITVSPNANLTLPSNRVVCNGSILPSITFTTTNTGGTTSYSWTNDTPGIGLAASGTGNIPIFTALNTGLVPIIATISVTPSFSNGTLVCSGASQTITITVNPSAQVNSINNIEVCNGNAIPSIVFSTNNSGGVTTYSWTNSNISIGLAASGSGNIPAFTATNTGSTQLIATITIIPTYTNAGVNCNGTSQSFTIKINPSPTGTISGTINVCLNATAPQVTFTGSAGNPPYIFTYNINNGANQTISTTSGNSVSINALTNTLGIFTYNLVNVQDSNATSCINTLSQSATVTVTAAPSIVVPPIPTQSICVGGTIQNPLTVSFVNGTGTPTYQWYSNTNNTTTGGIPVGTNSPTYQPSVFNTVGSFYYYVIISFSGNGCGSVTSATAEIVVVSDPIVSIQPIATQTLCLNETPSNLTVTISGGIGTISYQWYSTSTSTNTGGTAVGTNSLSFTPPTNSVGTFYYYCSITQSGVACSVNSNSATVIINSSPTIVIQPSSSTVCQSGTPTTLSFTYSNGVGTPTYQWYSNSSPSNIGGNIITNAINPTYIPPSTSVGIFYYYSVITFPALIGNCSSVPTNVAVVTVNPQSTIDTQPLSNQSLCIGGTIQNPLSVTFINGTGTPTYQWYSNTNNTTTGGIPVGTNSPNYQPPVFNTVGSFYYYVIISFSGNGCGSATSAAAEIVVVSDPIVSTQPIATQTLCLNETPSNLTVTISGGIGAISYQWYSTSTLTNTGGTAVGTNSSSFTPPTNSVGTFYYYCSITQSGVACSVNSNSATVIINSSPTIVIQPISSTVCQSGTPTTLSFTYSNGVGTPTYQWYSNSSPSNTGGISISNAINPTYIPPSTSVGIFYYYCVITFPALIGNCSSVPTNVATVTINPQSTIDTQPLLTQTICVGGTIQNPLTVSFINGTGTPTYQWYSNTNNTTTGGVPVGTNSPNYTPPVFTTANNYFYYVIISFSGNGCGSVTSAVAEIAVVPDPIINIQPLTTQTICQFVIPATLSVTVSGGIGTTYFYQWYSNITNNNTLGSIIPGETNSTFIPPSNNVGTTYYYCIITQANGLDCNVSSATAEIIVNLAPAIAIQPASSAICIGQTPTLLSVTYTNGVGTPQYQWYSNIVNSTVGGTPISGATSANYNPQNLTAATTYYYCVITFSSGGCSNITSNVAEVIINQNPVITSQNPIICSGTAFTVTPNNSGGNIVPTGTTYTWANPTITPAGSITGAIAEPTPQTTISQTLINTTTSPSTVVYTVTPLSGVCVGTNFTITVTVNPSISPNTTVANSICYGSNSGSITTNITGGIPFSSGPPYIISWTGPAGFTSSAANISALAPGVYNLTVTDFGGCPFSNSYTITEPADIVITTDLEKDITCFGAADGEILITVTGGTPPYFYTWTKNTLPFATTEDITNLGPGVYFVSVTDSNSCGPRTATFTITEPPILVVSLVSQTNVLCYGAATGAITINTVGGTPIQISPGVFDYTYSWTGPNGFISSSQNLTNLPAGIYNLTVTDNSGCIKNLTVTLTQPTEIIITAVTTPITCYGANNASITVTITGGNPAYQIAWSNLALGLYQSNLSAGNYTITVTDATGCQKSLTINIPQAPVFTTNPIVTQITCFGANNGSINLNLTGGIPTVSLVWADGSPAGLIRNNLGPGTYAYTIVDGTPCTITGSFTLIQPQALVLTANITNALNCTNANTGAINLLVSGGTPPFTYSWSNGATTEDLNTISAGNYSVTVTDSRGCVKTGQYSITSPAPIVLNVNTTTVPNCPNFSISQNFSAQVSGGLPPYQFNWSSGVVSGSTNQFMTTNQNGLIVLTATDALGCTANYTFNVVLPILADAAFDVNSIGYTNYGEFSIIDPIQFTNTAVGDFTSILWDFGDGTFSNEENPIHSYVNEGSYVVTQTVTYPFGCTYTHIITLVIKKGYLLVVPNAFTPNNDNLNDTFRPVTKALTDVRMDIYDTWGSMIYTEMGDVLTGWDATIKGVKAENGNYYCKVSGKTFYGTDVSENHTFVLIK